MTIPSQLQIQVKGYEQFLGNNRQMFFGLENVRTGGIASAKKEIYEATYSKILERPVHVFGENDIKYNSLMTKQTVIKIVGIFTGIAAISFSVSTYFMPVLWIGIAGSLFAAGVCKIYHSGKKVETENLIKSCANAHIKRLMLLALDLIHAFPIVKDQVLERNASIDKDPTQKKMVLIMESIYSKAEFLENDARKTGLIYSVKDRIVDAAFQVFSNSYYDESDETIYRKFNDEIFKRFDATVFAGIVL